MDHGWDGFYTSQLRQSRFPAIIDAIPKDSVTEITYTGTPPKKQLFELYSQDESSATIVRIAYPSAMAYQVKKDGKYVEMTQWDDEEKNYGKITRSFCGENRYLGVKNILEFYITPDCSLIIEPRNAIQSKVRMEWTLEEFYKDGGTTAFVDRLAASLGIHASTIKVVGVYEGSLIVDYNIFTDSDSVTQLEQIKATQTEQIVTGVLNIGAPILDMSSNDEAVVSDGVVSAPGYDPIVITQTVSNMPEGWSQSVVAEKEVINTESRFEGNTFDFENTRVFDPSIAILEDEEQRVARAAAAAAAMDDSHQLALILMISLGAVGLVLAFVFMRFLINLNKKQAIDLTRIQQTKEQIEMKHTSTVDPRDFSSQKKLNGNNISLDDPICLEPQYDPNTDFRIFSNGDATQGGVQNLQDKMNLADQTGSTKSTKSPESSSANNLPEDVEVTDE